MQTVLLTASDKSHLLKLTCSAGGDTTNNINFKDAAHIRRNSHMYLYNSIVMGYPDGINIDGSNEVLHTAECTSDTNGSEQYHRYKTGCKEIITFHLRPMQV